MIPSLSLSGCVGSLYWMFMLFIAFPLLSSGDTVRLVLRLSLLHLAAASAGAAPGCVPFIRALGAEAAISASLMAGCELASRLAGASTGRTKRGNCALR